MSQAPNFLDGAPTYADVAAPTGGNAGNAGDSGGGDDDSRPDKGLSDIPELCGFKDATTPWLCPTGQTCMFNTDIYAAACCSSDSCDWATTCCGYELSATSASVCGRGISARSW